ncbi:MAG: hypothetical protein QRY74_00355 [Chlamydia sp.]
MVIFKIVNIYNDIPSIDDFIISIKFKNKYKIVSAEGKVVNNKAYKGKTYRLIEKREKPFSILERIGRIFLGILIVICTLSLGLLSNNVRHLFTKSKITIRFAMPFDLSQTVHRKAYAIDYF